MGGWILSHLTLGKRWSSPGTDRQSIAGPKVTLSPTDDIQTITDAHVLGSTIAVPCWFGIAKKALSLFIPNNFQLPLLLVVKIEHTAFSLNKKLFLHAVVGVVYLCKITGSHISHNVISLL